VPVEGVAISADGRVQLLHPGDHVAAAPRLDAGSTGDPAFWDRLYRHYGYLRSWSGVGNRQAAGAR
jgi:hypothetical protein